ncbi:MAG TPA: DUF6435 family protein [Kiritimatiellia bacterium]|nr:DUF6435 family protein [Kiritimatiellia bacterium]
MKWFWQKKSPVEKLRKAYQQRMEEARDAQRSGDIQATARLNEEAEALLVRLRAEEASS